jgi:predicted transcriptional regulator
LLDADWPSAFVASPADLLTGDGDADLDLNAWHRAESEAALQEAEAGDFATADEIEAAFEPSTQTSR